MTSRKNKHKELILLRNYEISVIDTLKLFIIRIEKDLEVIGYPKSIMN